MFGINIVYILLVTISALIYKYINYLYLYWERHGVPQLSPKFPFGNFGQNFRQKISIGDIVAKIYNSSTEPFIGVYTVLKPTLVIRDPKLIHSICVNDFQYFMGRGVYSDEKHDPLTANLFGLDGERWKMLRTKLTPTFTPSKLKMMIPIMVQFGDRLQKCMGKLVYDVNNNIDNELINNGFIDVREVVARYTNDIIASVGFGIDANSIENPDDEFRKCGRKVFEISFRNGLKFVIFVIWPLFFKMIGMKMFDKSIEDFMFNVVRKNLEHREKNNISRQDFFQYLIELRKSTTPTTSSDESLEFPNDNMTLEVMTAQSFVFFTAGFETTSATMGFFLYEMARHPDIQQRVREEIDQILGQNNGELTFDTVGEMIYLDWCIDETLRLYPALPFLNRVSTQSYKIPDTNVCLEKDITILISPLGLHRDPKYFPNPEKFIPERFSPENIANKTFTDMPYLPFGIGPKNCIGLRLGKLQTKIGLVKMLQNFKYELTENEQHLGNIDDYIEFSPAGFILAPKHELLLKITNR